MAFQSMLSGAECSTSSNTLSQFLKHAQTDRSLQQDQMQGAHPGMAEPSAGMRTSRMGGGTPQEMEAFMRQQGRPGGHAFDMSAMHAEMERMRAGVPARADTPPRHAGPGASWAQEMRAQGGSMHPGFVPAHGGVESWGNEFRAQVPHGAEAAPRKPAMGPQRPMYGGGMYMPGMGSYGMRPPMGSVNEPQSAKAAGKSQLVELDDAKWEEQFRKLEEEHAEHAAASEQEEMSAKGKDKESADEEAQLRELREFQERLQEAPTDNPRFEELWNALKDENGALHGRGSEEIAEWEKELMEAIANEDPSKSMHPGGGLGHGIHGLSETAGLDGTEDDLRRVSSQITNEHPELGPYQYAPHNPYMAHPHPYAEGMRLIEQNGSLTDAALLFEAAAQQEELESPREIGRSMLERSRAWQKLGECQAMNEHEEAAIQALEHALELSPENLEVYAPLAVSYINEGYDNAANQTLLQYINRTHPHIAPSATFPTLPDQQVNPWARLNYVRDLFLRAAREDAAENRMDPDVQIGLGVLFYSSSSYDQARDCFETALKSRPNDWQLWNRLGATLANGGKPEMAIDAYQRALELRPSFTRAIYNLSVSCLNLGAHHEAAEHLLSALSLQRSQVLPNAPEGEVAPAPPLAAAKESESLWSTLRSIFVVLNRQDLADMCTIGHSLEPFRAAGFDF